MSEHLYHWSVASGTVNVYVKLLKLINLFVSVHRILI